MAKVTILGAGITGLAIASQLPKTFDITIVARNLPGDEDSSEWASPWAGAVFMPMDPSTEREQRIQLESFRSWWQLAQQYPESGVSQVEMEDLIDSTALDKVWYRNKLPHFRVLSKNELPPNASFGMSYKSIILIPSVFLAWQKKRLETAGVRFLRRTVNSLAELKDLGHDILINAAGVGARYLNDVADKDLQEVRGQTVLVKSDFNKIWIRRGKDYTYALGRPDGTAILGGIKQYNNATQDVDAHLRADIFQRIYDNLPKVFPSSDPKDFKVIRDIVGIRPQRVGGARVEKAVVDGQLVVHAYGFPGGGYIASWGIAREVCRLVDGLYPSPEIVSAKL
ncbi:nucleotide-binding domain-containing protein [Aspergillus karnatakaensis]|uniref:FAD-dependent oxidoreductase n=1 Tax=Aspergillus karnatakaensis TaxID=1810916 RepID=UPI003CCCA7A9